MLREMKEAPGLAPESLKVMRLDSVNLHHKNRNAKRFIASSTT